MVVSIVVTEEHPDGLRYGFGNFELDVPDRQLWQGEARIDLNARYLDALILLVRERGQLVEKSRLFEDVWGDVVVSDSALTQCIKEIRKQLGDDAANPHFIQTVPRYGYRFVGEVRKLSHGAAPSRSPVPSTTGESVHDDGGYSGVERSGVERGGVERSGVERGGVERGGVERSESDSTAGFRFGDEKWRIWRKGLAEWGVGTLGGGLAGLLGGLLYGFGLSSVDAGVGTLSTLLVIVTLCALVGLTGGLGVSLGLAGAGIIAHFMPSMRMMLRVTGAAFGGLLVGALVKLLSVDAFNLLFGRAPAGITGGPEGAALGGTLVLGAWLGSRLGKRSGREMRWHLAAGAGLGGAIAGALIPLAGGSLMGGSLNLLAKSFVESRLQLDILGPLFGELHFGLATQVILGGFEGLLFGGCVIGALTLVVRFRDDGSDIWRL